MLRHMNGQPRQCNGIAFSTHVYHENGCEASFYWEFGGRDIIAIIQGGPASGWNEKYPWAANRREEVLERVIKGVIRQKAQNCIASIDEISGEILLRYQ